MHHARDSSIECSIVLIYSVVLHRIVSNVLKVFARHNLIPSDCWCSALDASPRHGVRTTQHLHWAISRVGKSWYLHRPGICEGSADLAMSLAMLYSNAKKSHDMPKFRHLKMVRFIVTISEKCSCALYTLVDLSGLPIWLYVSCFGRCGLDKWLI